jgi:hypothetical protein
MPISKFHRLELDALIRALAVNRGRSLSMLLGAGASISSGMPSADRCIWEWKQDIFATNNPTLRESVGEISLAGTKRRIQEWLDRRGGYPPSGSQTEYSFFAEACFPTSTDRRSFFQQYVKLAVPFLGYRLMPLLVIRTRQSGTTCNRFPASLWAFRYHLFMRGPVKHCGKIWL